MGLSVGKWEAFERCNDDDRRSYDATIDLLSELVFLSRSMHPKATRTGIPLSSLPLLSAAFLPLRTYSRLQQLLQGVECRLPLWRSQYDKFALILRRAALFLRVVVRDSTVLHDRVRARRCRLNLSD